MQTVQETGTYVIRCLVNGKVYVGSSRASLEKRKQYHFATLRRGSHYAKRMQQDFNEYGESQFVFEVVQLISGENITDAEKDLIKYHDATNPLCGYNTSKTPLKGGGQPRKAVGAGRVILVVSIYAEQERKIEKAAKKRGVKVSVIIRELIDAM
jgi:group I intron endonuclease